MATKVHILAMDGKLHIRYGLNTNCYAFSTNKELVVNAAKVIGKVESAVYFNVKHRVWVIRCCCEKHIQLLLKLKEDIDNDGQQG